MRNGNIFWPQADGAAFSSDWATSTTDQFGAAGTDTFVHNARKGRINCLATAGGNTKQWAAFNNPQANHRDLVYRGTVSWDDPGPGLSDATTFMVRSTNVQVANNNFATACYVFEMDTNAGTLVAYKVTASTPAAITGAPAAATITYLGGTVYACEFSIRRYTLTAKLWPVGTDEGAATIYTVIDPDASIPASTIGKFGWGNYHNIATAETIDIGSARFTTDLASPSPTSRLFLTASSAFDTVVPTGATPRLVRV